MYGRFANFSDSVLPSRSDGRRSSNAVAAQSARLKNMSILMKADTDRAITVSVKPLPDYRLEAEFADGTKGIADMSYLLENPLLADLADPAVFGKVSIGPGGCLWWGEGLDVSWEGIYMQISGKHWKEALAHVPKPEFIEPVSAHLMESELLWVEFSDGTSGEVRISSDLETGGQAGKTGEMSASCPVIAPWGHIILNDKEYDADQIYERIAGVSIDAANAARREKCRAP